MFPQQDGEQWCRGKYMLANAFGVSAAPSGPNLYSRVIQNSGPGLERRQYFSVEVFAQGNGAQ
jgi:hypothetical protein